MLNAIVSEIKDVDMDVFIIPLCTTPLTHFAVKHCNANSGIMITASHNPAKYNSFKFFHDGFILHEKDILSMLKTDIKKSIKVGDNAIIDIIDDYILFLGSFCKLESALKVA